MSARTVAHLVKAALDMMEENRESVIAVNFRFSNNVEVYAGRFTDAHGLRGFLISVTPDGAKHPSGERGRYYSDTEGTSAYICERALRAGKTRDIFLTGAESFYHWHTQTRDE